MFETENSNGILKLICHAIRRSIGKGTTGTVCMYRTYLPTQYLYGYYVLRHMCMT